jgi:outer membrane usher protein
VPYVTPYVLNTLTIDPTGLPLDVQLDNTSAQVAPRAGAVVLVKFKSKEGRFVLIQTRLADGGTLPFGAEVEDAAGQSVGVVGQAGRIMARLSDPVGEVRVHWVDDSGAPRSCALPYHLPVRSETGRGAGAIEQIEATCSPPAHISQVARSIP